MSDLSTIRTFVLQEARLAFRAALMPFTATVRGLRDLTIEALAADRASDKREAKK